jgi:hypothetical protein
VSKAGPARFFFWLVAMKPYAIFESRKGDSEVELQADLGLPALL